MLQNLDITETLQEGHFFYKLGEPERARESEGEVLVLLCHSEVVKKETKLLKKQLRFVCARICVRGNRHSRHVWGWRAKGQGWQFQVRWSQSWDRWWFTTVWQQVPRGHRRHPWGGNCKSTGIKRGQYGEDEEEIGKMSTFYPFHLALQEHV